MSEMKETCNKKALNGEKTPWYKDEKKLFYYGLMLFPLLQFCVFYIGVNFQSILLAFQKYENSKFVFLSGDIFDNFKEVFKYFFEYDTLSIALKNSVILWAITVICGTGLAIFFSYYVFKSKTTGRFFRFILFLPSILPAILMSIVFELFSNDVLPVALGWPQLINSTDGAVRLTGVIFYCVFIGFGTQVLLYSNAMEQISPSVIEAAQLDGAPPLTELFHIILPEIMPTVCTFMVASIAGAFMNQANQYNFYGEEAVPETYTLGYYMFIIVQNNSKFYGREYYGFASALGLCCTAVAIPLTLLFRKFSERFEE